MRPALWPKLYMNRKRYIQHVASRAGLKAKFDVHKGFVLLDGETEVVVKKRSSSLGVDLDAFLKEIQTYLKEQRSVGKLH